MNISRFSTSLSAKQVVALVNDTEYASIALKEQHQFEILKEILGGVLNEFELARHMPAKSILEIVQPTIFGSSDAQATRDNIARWLHELGHDEYAEQVLALQLNTGNTSTSLKELQQFEMSKELLDGLLNEFEIASYMPEKSILEIVQPAIFGSSDAHASRRSIARWFTNLGYHEMAQKVHPNVDLLTITRTELNEFTQNMYNDQLPENLHNCELAQLIHCTMTHSQRKPRTEQKQSEMLKVVLQMVPELEGITSRSAQYDIIESFCAKKSKEVPAEKVTFQRWTK
ncbi:hypothetical protein [uncultured Shewanella sp.]|uniref:hypothetical protein n=1 Tax=uncultured Shewanella sp. TaxID=173975 RepID=UPI002608C65D|nr:hypothetical protein [uncultured Shewanella sp.]